MKSIYLIERQRMDMIYYRKQACKDLERKMLDSEGVQSSMEKTHEEQLKGNRNIVTTKIEQPQVAACAAPGASSRHWPLQPSLS